MPLSPDPPSPRADTLRLDRRGALAALSAVFVPSVASARTSSAIGERLPTAVRELAALVALANDVRDPEAVNRNAEHLRSAFARRGLRVRLLPTPSGRPLVAAETTTRPGRPTYLVYSHYDGVGVDRARWTSDPYRLTLKSDGAPLPLETLDAGRWDPEWRIYGRSVADSKNAIVTLLTVLDHLRAQGREPGVNLRVILDGEEEAESPGLAATLEAHPQLLAADLVICASGERHQSDRPTVSFGMRGILTFDIELFTAAAELHSGHFGNFAPNAGQVLAGLIDSFKGADGRVLIRGFADDARPLEPDALAALAATPDLGPTLRRRYGLGRVEQPGRRLPELINQPTFNLRGLEAGGLGPRARNIIAPRARAEFDVRLVAGMDPDATFAAIQGHVERAGIRLIDAPPDAAALAAGGPMAVIRKLAGFAAVRTSMSNPAAQAAVRKLAAAFREPLVLQPTDGGSVDFNVFAQAGLPLISVPVSNSDCAQHSHDENLRLGHFAEGLSAYEALLA